VLTYNYMYSFITIYSIYGEINMTMMMIDDDDDDDDESDCALNESWYGL